MTFAVLISACARPGKVELSKGRYSARLGTAVSALSCPPGAQPTSDCADGGPLVYTFHMQNRKAAFANSLSAFYAVSAMKVAVSQHFVVYRDFNATAYMSTSKAQSILTSIETGYSKLLENYGDGQFPQIQKTGRIVILATDILDDYSGTNPAFVAGFFAPRDLYSDTLTTALFNDPVTISQYSNDFVLEVRGRSNENQILYLDVNPFLNGAAYSGDTVKAEALFKEAILHEASHLMTYYRRVMLGELKNHQTWIAEGLAEQAPVVSSGFVENVKDRLSQSARADIRAFLAVYPSLFEVDTLPQPLAGLVQSHLFFEYLRHRTGSTGENIIRSIITQPNETQTGVASSITSVWNSSESFASLFSDWVITNFLMMDNRSLTEYREGLGQSPVNLGSGTYPSRGYDFSYKGVSIEPASGSGSVKFAADSLPKNYAAGAKCLPPGSFLYSFYTTASPGPDTDYTPSADGMDPGLRLAIADVNTTGSAKVTLLNTTDTVAFSNTGTYPAGSQYVFIVWNPALSGSCLTTGNIRVDARNIASWVGSGNSNQWQTIPGAYEGKNGGEYQRPTGVALFLAKKDGDKNYLYAADALNWGVSRWDMDTGEFLGRMGSPLTTSTDFSCSTDNSSLDGWIANTTNIYGHWCRRSFWTPKGLDTDSVGNIYVADYDNGRIVKRNKDGAFVAWLGHPTDDKWQCEPGNSFPECQGMGTANPMQFPNNYPNYVTDVKILNRPHDVLVQEGAEADSITANINNGAGYSSGDTSLVFDSLTSANAILPGHVIEINGEKLKVTNVTYNGDNISGTLTVKRGILGTTAATIADNMNIQLFKSYLYISNFGSHRIVRRDLYTGVHRGFIGNGIFDWNTSTTLQTATSGTTPGYLANPTGLAFVTDSTEGNYLFIADKTNNRVVKWPLNGSSTGIQFLGNSQSGWHATASSALGKDLYGMDIPQSVALYREPSDSKLYLLVADTNNYRISKYRLSDGTAFGWIGGGYTQWNTGATAPTGNPAQLLPPEFLEQPQFITVGVKGMTGSKHDYLYVNNNFNGRTVRFNLDCVYDNTGGDCSGD